MSSPEIMIENTSAARPTALPRDAGRSRRRRDGIRRPADRVDERARQSALTGLADVASVEESAPMWAPAKRRSEQLNRVVNFVLASVAVVLLAPILLLVAFAVRLTSRGPVIYVQERVGIDRRARRTLAMFDRRAEDAGGSVFRIYKFRTMRVDAEEASGAVWAVQNDPRVTPIGRFLRRSRLDELPQLVNVIRGDMNIVGPRPERPTIFMNLRENIAEYPQRQRTRPGITGLAQISHNYDTCLDDVRTKVSYDLEYLRRQSLWEDVKIMAKTVPVMLFKKGGW